MWFYATQLLIWPVRAQQIAVLAGGLQSTDNQNKTYSWQIDYSQILAKQFGISFTFTNEGHLPKDHRDGGSVQLWYYLRNQDNKGSIAFGIGPYRYYDTISKSDGAYENRHGVGKIVTLRAEFPIPDTSLALIVQGINIHKPGEVGTTAVLAGVSYKINPSISTRSIKDCESSYKQNSINIDFGKNIVNSLNSESNEAWMVEYRKFFSRYWSFGINYVNEGSNKRLQRDAIGCQLWLGETYFNDKFRLELGVGPYLARVDSTGEILEDKFNRIGLRTSMGASWKIGLDWAVRAHWDRALTSYDRDTDSLLLGLGYMW